MSGEEVALGLSGREVLCMADRWISGHKGTRVSGTVTVPGDKSIAHRVLILGSLARGTTFAKNVPVNDDIQATLRCLRALGVPCERAGDAVSVRGLGKAKYQVPEVPLDCGGSATTMRLLLGAIAGRGQGATLKGDKHLSSRPMDRVVKPLSQMGARFDGVGERFYPPVTVESPKAVLATEYTLEIPSAQVKTAIILAGLHAAKGRTIIRGAIHSRDHTERLVPQMGGSLVVTPDSIVVERSELDAIATNIPGDISSAAFFAAAAAILESSHITIRKVGTNPTRMGFFEVLSWMGGDVTIEEACETNREPYGDITVKWKPLKAVEIHREGIPFLIDEVPLVMLLACFAEGETVIHNVSELKVKETDRLKCTIEGLTRMGAKIDISDDSVRIQGVQRLRGACLDPWGDHRMAMMFTIAALAASGDSVIKGVDCETKSYPEFFPTLERLVG